MASRRPFHTASDAEIKSGEVSDVYFARTVQILKARNVNRRVKAEIRLKSFPQADWTFGVLAGAPAFDSERLRVSGIPFAQVSTEGCCSVAMVLRGDRSSYDFKGQLRGDSLTGVFLEGTNEGLFAYVRAKPAVATFEEREITFRNGDLTLAGTLLLPRGQGRVPAVVFLHGSGAEGRWASRNIAGQIAARGIASLILDKRGVGGSSGDWRVAGPDDLAADGVAAVARLLDEPRIDPKRIGIHGHSQGGTLAPMVAVRSPHVAFIIGSAAAGLRL